MRILVTGSNGQLGNQFKEVSKLCKDHRFYFATRYEVDITKPKVIEKAISDNRIDCIINCASYTGVDSAEENIADASDVNAIGVENLAAAAAKYNVFLVHFSTDYLFDGKSNIPYNENDMPNPKTEYGKSKYAGEKAILLNLNTGLIIRTAWLYSTFGNNFVKTIYKKGKDKEHLKVVCDQVGSPTYSYDLAHAVMKILPEAVKVTDRVEVYNYSNEGVTSWYDMAVAIADIKNLSCIIEPVMSEQFPTKAIRPHYSLLNKNKIKSKFNLQIPHWRHSLERCLKKIK